MATPKSGYNRFLLLVAGLGGLLYGVDVGIIAGALPYLEATSGLNRGQLSFIVAAVLLGGFISSLFAGLLADWLGRKPLMALSGILFVASIPVIALSHGYGPLVFGRLLQGISAGLIGVVVPLYLAECLGASNRGKGTAIFQWLLTLGIVTAALISMYFSIRVAEVAKTGDAARLLAFQDAAWRGIFWVSLPPGVLFLIGSLLVAESPRWLFRRGRKEAALASLLRSRTEDQAALEMKEMEEAAAVAVNRGGKVKESLLRRKYVLPFILACIILGCNQATGINSIIGYSTAILLQSGLSDVQAHWGYVILTMVNFLMTIGAVLLVDRKGRKFLLTLGTAGIIVSLLCVGILFRGTEKSQLDVKDALQPLVSTDQKLNFDFNQTTAAKLLRLRRQRAVPAGNQPTTLVVIYSYGGYHAATKVLRSDDPTAKPLEISRAGCVPPNKVVGFFSNPFADLAAARTAPLKIENALVTPVPSGSNGWLVAIGPLRFHGIFCGRPRRLRVAGAIRIDADAHSFQRHEHRALHQPSRLDRHCGDVSAYGRQIRLFDHVFCLRRLHRDLFHHRGFLPAGDQEQNP